MTNQIVPARAGARSRARQRCVRKIFPFCGRRSERPAQIDPSREPRGDPRPRVEIGWHVRDAHGAHRRSQGGRAGAQKSRPTGGLSFAAQPPGQLEWPRAASARRGRSINQIDSLPLVRRAAIFKSRGGRVFCFDGKHRGRTELAARLVRTGRGRHAARTRKYVWRAPSLGSSARLARTAEGRGGPCRPSRQLSGSASDCSFALDDDDDAGGANPSSADLTDGGAHCFRAGAPLKFRSANYSRARTRSGFV